MEYIEPSIHGTKHLEIIFIDLGLFKGVNTFDFTYEKISNPSILSIRYCLDESSVALSISLPENMKSLHTQIVDNGREVPKVGSNDNAWVGFLVGSKDNILSEIKEIVINTNHGSKKPFYLIAE